MKNFVALLSFALITALCGAASAFTYELDLDDCDADGCEGSDVFLGIDDLGGGAYTVTLILDADDYTGDRDGIGQIGFKAFSVVDASNVTLSSAPGGVGAWDSPTESSINSGGNDGGCGSGGTNNHICSDGFVDITGGGTYTWVFDVTGATILSSVGDWHIGGQYCDADPDSTRCNGKIISTSGGNPIPEPSAALVFGIALLVAAPHLRRR